MAGQAPVMANSSRASEVAAVDEFLQTTKVLFGPTPDWQAGFGRERQAIWNVQESTGVIRGHLRFKFPLRHRTSPCISVIVRNRLAWRIDLIDEADGGPVVKYNPPSAAALGLPAKFTGSHEHRWDDNRDAIVAGTVWELPIRRPTQAQIKRLPQALASLAASINLQLTQEQYGFDIPPHDTLFGYND